MYNLFDYNDMRGDDEDFYRGYYTATPKQEVPPLRERTILSLFDRTGNWARPYANAGYDVRIIDTQNIWGADVMDIDREWLIDHDLTNVWGILAALPCTDFAVSGARWFEEKDQQGETQKSIQLLKHTIDIIEFLMPSWWVLENPVGRINRLWPHMNKFGPWYFQPCDFGDPYTKKTGLWGEYNNKLLRTPVEPTEGSKMWKLGPSQDRANLRSETPKGFAKAFFDANP